MTAHPDHTATPCARRLLDGADARTELGSPTEAATVPAFHDLPATGSTSGEALLFHVAAPQVGLAIGWAAVALSAALLAAAPLWLALPAITANATAAVVLVRRRR